jgi:hypothetical protein
VDRLHLHLGSAEIGAASIGSARRERFQPGAVIGRKCDGKWGACWLSCLHENLASKVFPLNKETSDVALSGKTFPTEQQREAERLPSSLL